MLESIKEKIVEAVENSSPEFPDRVFDYISTAISIPAKYYSRANWIKIVELFYLCISKSPSIKLPIVTPTDEKFSKEPWDYANRTWHLYSHLIAKEYGWSLPEISRLQVVDALSMIQEIMVDKQLEREFYYGLSEIAYPYNEQTKKSIFKPLERPHWMRVKILPVPRFKIPKDMMPVGVVKIDGAIPEEYLPKEIIH